MTTSRPSAGCSARKTWADPPSPMRWRTTNSPSGRSMSCGRAIDAAGDHSASEGTIGAMRPGDIVGGRFRLTREAGRGGMGMVYQALDLARGGVPVAVKVLRRDQ